MIIESFETICNVCKLSLWEWDSLKECFKTSGYFGSFEGSLKSFLTMIDPNEYSYLEKIIQENLSFEIIFRIANRNISSRLYMRGQIHPTIDNKMCGIILGIDEDKHNQDNCDLHLLQLIKTSQAEFQNKAISRLIHELTQPLTVINTYIIGCIYRLQEDKINHEQFLDVMNKMKKHSAILGQSIHKLNSYLSSSHIQYRDLMT